MGNYKIMTMIRALLLMLTTLFLLSFMEIKYNETIWTNQTKVDKVIQYEKTTNANVEFLNMNVTLSKSIYPLIDTFKIAKPIIVALFVCID